MTASVGMKTLAALLRLRILSPVRIMFCLWKTCKKVMAAEELWIMSVSQ